MKKLVQSASKWVLGMFLSDVEAGACPRPYCCKPNYEITCTYECTHYVPYKC
jgi:hypothetical protein